MEILRWSRVVMCLVFMINSFGLSSSRQSSVNMKRRSISEDTRYELLLSGEKKILDDSATTQKPPACLEHEYGPSCTYCTPQNTCVDGYYTCNKTTGEKICRTGWYGRHCNQRQEVTNYHVTCPESQCRNGGSCVSQQCCCNEGFTGVLCEIEIIECTNTSCENGGICKDEIGSFSCLCKPNYSGKHCEIRLDTSLQTTTSRDSQCQSSTCQNGGRCFEDAYYTYCVCPTGYTGDKCETRLFSNTSVVRQCPDYHYGERCDVICIPQNNCHDGHFICDPFTGSKICSEGWIGKNCDNRILPQQIDPACPEVFGCKNDGQCFEKQCCCKHNYTGSICNIESIGCLSNPCLNNATCYPSGNGYFCDCGDAFTGKQCETLIAPSKTFTWSSTIEPSLLNLGATNSFNNSNIYMTSSLTAFSYNNVLTNSTMIKSVSGIDSTSSFILSSSIVNTESMMVSILETSSASVHTPFYPSLITSSSSTSTSMFSNQMINSSLSINVLDQSLSGHLSNNQPQHTQNYPSISSTMMDSSSIMITSAPVSSDSVGAFSEYLISSPISSSLETVSPTASVNSITTSVPYSSTDILTSVDKTNTGVISMSHSRIGSSDSISTPVLNTQLSGIDTSTERTKQTPDKHDVSSTRPTYLRSSISKLNISTFTPTIAATRTFLLSSSTLSTSYQNSPNLVIATRTVATSSYPTSSISPTSSAHSLNTVEYGKPDDTQNNKDSSSSDSGKSLAWWIILLIVAGILAVLAVIITVIAQGIQKRRSDSRNLAKKPELIDAYDKEHFSAQPDFQNHSFDIQDGDSDDDNVKQDMYIVNE